MLSYTDARQKVVDVAGDPSGGRCCAKPSKSSKRLAASWRGRCSPTAIILPSIVPRAMDSPCARRTRPRRARAWIAWVKFDAGGSFEGVVGPGQCVEIMTGAGMPKGADAVVMIEHTEREGRTITLDRAAKAGDHIVPRGNEARAGALLVPREDAHGLCGNGAGGASGRHASRSVRAPARGDPFHG